MTAAPVLNDEDEEILAAIDEGARDAAAGRSVGHDRLVPPSPLSRTERRSKN